MNETLTEAIREAYAIAPSTVVIYDTLEIRQVGVQDSYYLVRSRLPIRARDEDGIWHDFEPAGFQFSLPAANEEGFRSLNLSIDNIDRRVTDFVEAARQSTVPVEVIYRPFLSTDLRQPHMDPPLVLYLKDLQIIAMQVNGRATFKDITNKKFPKELYTRERFPSL